MRFTYLFSLEPQTHAIFAEKLCFTVLNLIQGIACNRQHGIALTEKYMLFTLSSETQVSMLHNTDTRTTIKGYFDMKTNDHCIISYLRFHPHCTKSTQEATVSCQSFCRIVTILRIVNINDHTQDTRHQSLTSQRNINLYRL